MKNNLNEFDRPSYDVENAKICIASASIVCKPNFNSYIAEPTSDVEIELFPASNIR